MKKPLKQDATFLEFLLHDNKTALWLIPVWMLLVGWQLAVYEGEPGFSGPIFVYVLAAVSAAIWLFWFYKIGQGYGDHIRGRSR